MNEEVLFYDKITASEAVKLSNSFPEVTMDYSLVSCYSNRCVIDSDKRVWRKKIVRDDTLKDGLNKISESLEYYKEAIREIESVIKYLTDVKNKLEDK